MKNFSLEQLKKSITNIRMSDGERMRIRRILEQHIHTAYTKPIRSPFLRHAHTYILRPMQAIAMVLVVLVSSGAGLSYAASEALPGDSLYGFKVNVNEEFKTITMDPNARAQYEVSRAAKRLEETAQLAITGRLDKNAEMIVREQLQKHTEKAQESAKKASANDPEATIAITSSLENELSARGKVLEEIQEVKNINGELSAILDATQTTLDEIAIDKEIAIQTVVSENSDVTRERVENKYAVVTEKLRLLENMMVIPPATISSEVNEISNELDLLEIIPETTTPSESVTIINITQDTKTTLESPSVIEETISIKEDPTLSTQPTTIDDPTSVETITKNIEIIHGLVSESEKLAQENEYGKAFEILQQALEKADETLKLVALKEQYREALEESLIDTTITTVSLSPITETSEASISLEATIESTSPSKEESIKE